MNKIAINRKYGGFSLSNEAMLMYLEKTYPSEKIEVLKDDWGFPMFMVNGEEVYLQDVCRRENRENPILIEVIETLGERAYTPYSKLEIVEIPDDVKYKISEYDGMETVEEVHRTWC